MKAIPLRNIPEPLAQRIKQRAQKDRLSLNQAVLALLGEQLDRDAPTSFDEFFGTWTAEQEAEFKEKEIADELRSVGKPIPTNGRWIAACARAMGAIC